MKEVIIKYLKEKLDEMPWIGADVWEEKIIAELQACIKWLEGLP